LEDFLNLDSIFRIKDEVAFRKANDGTMTIVSPVTDKITTINATATEIWEMIDGNKSVAVIIDQFLENHSGDNNFPGKETVGKDVKEIIEMFLNRLLIEISGR